MISFSLLFLPATQFFSTLNPWRAFWADIEPFKSSQLRLVHCFWNFTDTRTQSGVLAQVTRYNRSKPILFMKCVKILKIHFAYWFLNEKGQHNTIELLTRPFDGSGGGRFTRDRQRREQECRQLDQEGERRNEERRIVYVGKISEGTTRADLRKRFEVFGPILEISVHFRDRGWVLTHVAIAVSLLSSRHFFAPWLNPWNWVYLI